MANAQIPNRLLWEAARKVMEVRRPVSRSGPSIIRVVAINGRCLLGAALLPLGILMMITLWLLPVGLPVALLGAALIATPADP
jgi:hypothetical protein